MGQSISWGFEVDSYDEISVCRISCEVIIAGSSLINEPSNNLSWIVIPIKDLKRLLGAYSQEPIREAYIHKNQITVFGNKLIGT